MRVANEGNNPTFLAYGASYCCCTPYILDNPLNDIQLLSNSIFPQAAASCCCPDWYGQLCGTPCTHCLLGCSACMLKCQGISVVQETFDTQEQALQSLLVLPDNPMIPDEIAGVWGFFGNPWGEQLISMSTGDWDVKKRMLRGDHAFVRAGWVERGDACGAFQQCIMSTGCQPGFLITFKDDSLHQARITLTLDPVCCPGTCFWACCGKVCGTQAFPCAGGDGYCIGIPQFINGNSFNVIGGEEGPQYSDWRNRQISACGCPFTCCNFSYTTRKVAHRNGDKLQTNWELYNKWIDARAMTQKGMRMCTQPFGPYDGSQPRAQNMERS